VSPNIDYRLHACIWRNLE